MKDEELKELEDMIREVSELNKDVLKNINQSINTIIQFKIQDEDTISRVFDQILSILFVEFHLIYNSFYKLLNYCKEFNQELASDYEEIFKEQYPEELKETQKRK